MALLIPIPKTNYQELVNLLDRVASYGWNGGGEIYVIQISDQYAETDGEMVTQFCQDNRIQDILVPERTHLDDKMLSEVGYNVIRAPGIRNLLRNDGLTKRLRTLKLDWRSKVEERLGRFSLGTIDEKLVNQWLQQFEYLDNHRRVGEHLLKLLDVMPTAELGDAVCTSSELFSSDLVVGFNQDSWGKSWGVVSNLIHKRCPDAILLPIHEAFVAGRYPKVLRLVEDGLFSGTETRSIFDSLRGVRESGNGQKVPKLQDPSVLKEVPAQACFGVVCDFGEKVVRRYMSLNAMPNIQISTSQAVRRIRVLLGKSSDTPSLHCSDKEFKQYLYSRVVPFAFQDDKGWVDEERRQRGKAFCQKVGEQLWRRYISGREGFDSSRWPDERMQRCALGMDGLGLTFAFPHSVPRATLPLFWAGGQVTLNGKSIEWIPLFPNANT